MASWKGLFTEYKNTVFSNAPKWLRKRAPSDVITIYDNYFAEATRDIMPRVQAPSFSGKPISYKNSFQVPITADPQYMSSYADYGERPTKRAIAFRRELYSPSMIQEDGPEWDPFEFSDEFVDGFVDFRNQFMNVLAIRAMNRRIEYDAIKYLYGDSSTINRFSPGVDTGRKKSLDATDSDDLVGTGWQDVDNAKPLKDLSTIRYHARDIMGQEITIGLIGNKTKWSLENNKSILDVMQYTTDFTNTVIGAQVGGVNMQFVGAQTYKDASSTSQPGMPGKGDIRETTFSRDNRTRFMTESSGGDTYEWALFVPGEVGNVFTARCHPKHENTESPYIHSWTDEETELTKTRLAMAYTPFVDDWARVFIVNKIAKL